MRVRELVETLKVRALPEGSDEKLLEFLRLFRDATQLVVNSMWSLETTPSLKTLHKIFYSKLVSYGLRAHHAKQIYSYAKAIVKSAKRNSGKKPILRKLTARIDKYDYRLNLENRILVLKLHNGYEAKLKLLVPKERIEKFLGWNNYEIAIRYDGKDYWVSIYFKKVVELKNSRTVMAVDINFDNVTLVVFSKSGKLLRVKRFRTPLRKLLTHRIWVERIQRRYPRSWRFIKGVRRVIKRHGERIRSIAFDYVYKLGDLVAELASKYGSIIVLENLKKVRENAKKSRSFNKKLSLWFYRRIQFAIEYKALEKRLETAYVNPRKTSSRCPRCGGNLIEAGYRVLKCKKCGFIGDRDVIACTNLFIRYSRCGVSGVALNAPKPDANPSGMRGNKNEGMISTNINLCQT
ncbi:MAG: RNA-guided endonuclease TnpB family protein [Desulfurococcus sp.]|uniref:RNA-guided endonuclease TnpB family protein n=1 Tax=Desulfurococcus sp. TaxID=51678 RepID=UPI0031655878